MPCHRLKLHKKANGILAECMNCLHVCARYLISIDFTFTEIISLQQQEIQYVIHKCAKERRRYVKAVCFYMDGTLIDSDFAVYQAMQRGVNMLRLPANEVTLEQARSCGGGSIRDLLKLFCPQQYQNAQLLENMAQLAPIVYNKAYLKEEITVFDGVEYLLKELKSQGWQLALVSNSPQFAVQQICDLFFKGYFDYAGGETGEETQKPNPASLHHAAAALGAGPKEIWYVGDTVVDQTAAAAAGMPFLAACWGANADSAVFRTQLIHPAFQTPAALLQYLIQGAH